MAKKLVTVRLKNGRVLDVPEKIAMMYERHGAQIVDPTKKPAELGTRTIPREITQPKKLVVPEVKAPAEIKADYPGDEVKEVKPPEVIKPKAPEVKAPEAPKAETPVKAPAKRRSKPKPKK